MTINTQNNDDVAQVPSDADDLPGGESVQNDIADPVPAGGDNEPSSPFQAKFREAAQKAAVSSDADDDDPDSEPDDEPDEATDGDDDLDLDNDDADDDIPADEDEDDPDTDDDASTNDEPAEPSKKPRSQAFKTLQTEHQQLSERISSLDKQFEKHGGVDVVETAMDIFSALAEGDAERFLSQLPAYEQQQLATTVLQQAVSDPALRVQSINSVLKNDFGLSEDMPSDVIEKAFEHMVYAYSVDPDEFRQFLERELEYASTPESELERTKRELERLKTQQTGEGSSEADADALTPELVAERVNKAFDAFEASTYERVAAPIFENYGLADLPSDSDRIKTAKTTLRNMVDNHVAVETRKSKAYEPLLPYWWNGEKDVENNVFFKQNARIYENAVRANLEQAVKAVATTFGLKGKKQSSGQPSKTGVIPGSTASRRSIKPTSDGKQRRPQGFVNVFRDVRRRHGV